MKIISEGKRDIKIIIENTNDIDKAYNYAENKLKHFRMFWDYNFFNKTGKDLLIIRKVKLKKCEICGKKDICEFEFENGKVYKICAECWAKLNK